MPPVRHVLGFRVPMGGDHDNRHIGTGGLGLGKQLQSGHPWHIDVGQDQDDRDTGHVINMLERGFAGLGKFHRETTRSKVTAKLLTKQNFDIRFVVNHENEKFHVRPRYYRHAQRKVTLAAEI